MFPKQRSFPVAPGTYQVSEAVPSDWFLRSVHCERGGVVQILADLVVTLEPGDNVTCTVFNDKAGRITIAKDTVPDDPRDFSFFYNFGIAIGGVFSLDDDGDATLPSSETISVRPSSSPYTVTESEVSGYAVSITCEDPTGNSSPNPDGRSASITVAAGEEVTCTFVNETDEDGDGVGDRADRCPGTVVRDAPVDLTTGCTPEQLGSITIVKDAVPGDPEVFEFEGDLGTFKLQDPAGDNQPSKTFEKLLPGSYEIEELVPPDWALTDISCFSIDKPDLGDVDLEFAFVEVELEQGQSITCIFTDVKLGSITIVKDALPNDAQDFAFTGPGGSFSLDDDAGAVGADGVLSDAETFVGLPPLGYLVTEALPPPGWALVFIDCDGEDTTVDLATSSAAITLQPGEHVTCFFENLKLERGEHYLGYEVRNERPVLRGEDVLLTDQFGEERVHVGTARLLLNPVEKRRQGKAAEPILRPDDHLKCYRVTGGLRQDRDVRVFNQFTRGGSTLHVKEPNRLCAPATKRLEGPPLADPAERQHYKCYRVEEEPRLAEERVELEDQFGILPVIVRRAEALCNPVTKQRDGRGPEPPPRPEDHLVCYGINEVDPFAPRDVFTRDQFITQRVRVEDPLVLCVPSMKVAVPSP
jgi:hypothetical protein